CARKASREWISPSIHICKVFCQPLAIFSDRMEDVPFVPLYNLASISGAARNLSGKMRPDEKVLG
ncbi:MAG TPA: hypothetical protein VFM35_00885, partial [Candidatus Binatia bacterium]|nr:hypothetical protein [Candidatus Binatia bacterium]